MSEEVVNTLLAALTGSVIAQMAIILGFNIWRK